MNVKEVDSRPGKGCIIAGWGAAAGGSCGLGLLTLVLLLANSSLMVCGMSGSKRTPCCGGGVGQGVRFWGVVFNIVSSVVVIEFYG